MTLIRPSAGEPITNYRIWEHWLNDFSTVSDGDPWPSGLPQNMQNLVMIVKTHEKNHYNTHASAISIIKQVMSDYEKKLTEKPEADTNCTDAISIITQIWDSAKIHSGLFDTDVTRRRASYTNPDAFPFRVYLETAI